MAKNWKRIMLIGNDVRLTAHIQLTFWQAARICISRAELARPVIRLFRPHVLVVFANVPGAENGFDFVMSLSPDDREVVESILVIRPVQSRERTEFQLRRSPASVRHFVKGDPQLLAGLNQAISQGLQTTEV